MTSLICMYSPRVVYSAIRFPAISTHLPHNIRFLSIHCCHLPSPRSFVSIQNQLIVKGIAKLRYQLRSLRVDTWLRECFRFVSIQKQHSCTRVLLVLHFLCDECFRFKQSIVRQCFVSFLVSAFGSFPSRNSTLVQECF